MQITQAAMGHPDTAVRPGSPEMAELENLRLLASHCVDVIARLGPDLSFLYVSPSAERMFRIAIHDIIGRNILEFIDPRDIGIVTDASRHAREERGSVSATLRVRRGDGSVIWVEATSNVIADGLGGVLGDRALVVRDVTERRRLEDELRAMAMRDGLTGLPNRRSFDESLLRSWRHAMRTGRPMSLLMIDIDHFKNFNDGYGHQVGDDCLRTVGAALAGAARPWDVVARYGGEELAVILQDADASDGYEIAERMRLAVQALAIPQCPRLGGCVTISIGTATALPLEGGSAAMPEAMIGIADKALYVAKAEGRNRCSRSILIASPA